MRTIRVLLALLAFALPAVTFGQIRVAIRIAPPLIPVYEQPICPGDGYLWTPGYWAWDDDGGDYYWVPGTWVMAPEVGFLWTPGYWGWGDGGYFWNEGYWGPTVGFYGGINYSFGYFGMGFGGGRWDGGHFFYNRAVMNINVTEIHNVYNTTIDVHNDNHVSFNGGNGGVVARPTPQEEAAAHERHLAPVSAQMQHASMARSNPQLRASANHGNPPIAATGRPGDFGHAVAGHGAEPSRSAEPGNAMRNGSDQKSFVHPKDLPPVNHPQTLDKGASKAEQKYQQQQEKLAAKQEQERSKLQQKQEAEHQKQMNSEQSQKLEQRHQQQTQQLQQRHESQQQSMQSHAPAPHEGRPR